MEENLIKEQTGFVPGMEIGVNIVRLNKEIIKFKENKNKKY